jgi:hypothetical protein
MPRVPQTYSLVGRRSCSMRSPLSKQQQPLSRCKLGPSACLIASSRSLTLPSIDGVQSRYQFSLGGEAVIPLVQYLTKEDLTREKHLLLATTPAEALQSTLTEIIGKGLKGCADQFGIELGISDGLDEHSRPSEQVLFFTWTNTADPQYIPLRPVYERLENNPNRESLMASLYYWLYRSASTVFEPFGFAEAESGYQLRRDWYLSEREEGEDVDLEGEVEFADLAKVVPYIRESNERKLKNHEIAPAIASIANPALRDAFQKAYRIFLASRAIRLPKMSRHCYRVLDEAAYYMDASPMPALGISHWRDDPIVAWFDEFCREQFESGETGRAPILLCFRPSDTSFFGKVVRNLRGMARAVAGLSEWVRFAEELENASHYADREQP